MRIPTLLAMGLSGCLFALRTEAKDAPVDFNRQIRPLLADRCFHCHGPDSKKRKADLRLDTKEGLFSNRDGSTPVVPGDMKKSELYQRITAQLGRMPPKRSGKKLSEEEISLIGRWIEQGARWSSHWSFVPPKRPSLPKVKKHSWARNGIDHFILARLEREGLTPAKEADLRTLVRRVSFDLTGLPPSPEDVEKVLRSPNPDAYEEWVDRLLASPHYGERIAVPWLDAARYADTNGFSIDDGRDMWVWRDWVLHALNTNMPFDQFTIEQLAGDLLPNPTIQQRVATGFNRNNMNTHEGGTIPEEYRVIYVTDRVRTTAETWLGLTMGCAQCHDHKYDPISQKDFYRFFAFFNSIPERGNDGHEGVNSVPFIKAPSVLKRHRLAEIDRDLIRLKYQWAKQSSLVEKQQPQWEEETKAIMADPPASTLRTHGFPDLKVRSKAGLEFEKLKDGSYLVTSTKEIPSDTYTIDVDVPLRDLTAIRLEVIPDARLPLNGSGRSDGGVFLLNEVEILINGKPVAIARATADFSQKDFPIEDAIDGNSRSAWGIHPQRGQKHQAIFWLAEPSEGGAVTVHLHQNEGWRMEIGRFRLAAITGEEPNQQLPPKDVQDILALPKEKRSEGQSSQLRDYFLSVAPTLKAIQSQIRNLEREKASLFVQTMVMQEMKKPRATHVLFRGQYDQPKEKVEPGAPEALPPLPKGAKANRLGLAQWLVQPDHPLTARVAVNRLWQMLYGTGIVRTSEDFGSQGEPPSHPELLDWMATEFVQSGWNIKNMIRLMVTSATYRQSSIADESLIARDPENRLLARGPRFRLSAEQIRDNALSVSGLLMHRLGGPSVKPYQPGGLWVEVSHWPRLFDQQRFVRDRGDSIYRRSIYTFIKRTSPPPALMAFDATNREVCTMRRARTNTPSQALVLLNDPQFLEASRALAERALLEKPNGTRATLERMFQLVLNRKPLEAENRILLQSFQNRLKQFEQHPDRAKKLLSIGQSPRQEGIGLAEHAAWTTIASTLINLHETMTKE